MTEYRELTIDEIEALECQGCSAEDWTRVAVAEGFVPERLQRVQFFGDVCLGANDGLIEVSEGFRKPCGVMDATLRNVTIGDGCLVERIGNHIDGYVFGDGCYISNVALIETTEGATFGEDNLISVLNEAGDGNLVLYHGLSSQLAALMVVYSGDKEFFQALRRMIREDVRRVRPDQGTIGNNVKLVNTTEIVNTVVGDDSEISGAMRLSDCTILSTANNPTFIGSGVIAESVVVDGGASLTSGVRLQDCFVGEACQLSNGFSATSSAFFANSYMSNGEACAALCGPFAASHHKSSLLIGVNVSFYNAGSATNFSNHAYKMGPIHYGMLQRGSKTASGSHLILPAQIGAFSVCINKITNHPDTRALPFSYIIGEGDSAYIVPGRNLITVGLYRDVKKWPKRDQRPASGRKSLVRFDWLSPYTVDAVLRGKRILEGLQKQCGTSAQVYPYQGSLIRRSSLEKGLRYYDLALRLFFGYALLLRREAGVSAEQSVEEHGVGEWIDLGGLLAPVKDVELLVEAIKSGDVESPQEVEERLSQIHGSYETNLWGWVRPLLLEYYEIEEFSEESEQRILNDYENARTQWLSLIRKDAEREFALGDVEEETLSSFLETLV